MLRYFGVSLLFLVLVTDAFGQPLRFVCETPRGKRVELGAVGLATEGLEWTDDGLEDIRPAVVVDGDTFTVTWGSSLPIESKGTVPKATTYIFASAYRDDLSILASRTDRTTAEIFRFYFNNKVLYKLTSSVGLAAQDRKAAPSMAAIHVANCREQ